MLPTSNRDSVSPDNYISLEEAKKMIPRFDGYNLDPDYFIEICQNVNSRLDPRHRKRLNNTLRKKTFGEVKKNLIGSDYNICSVLEAIAALKERLSKRSSEMFNLNAILKGNFSKSPRGVKKKPLVKYKKINGKIFGGDKYARFSEFFEALPNCAYCINFTHTTESHCCRFLKTNKPLTFAEQNLLSRRQFVLKLFKREIGL